MSLPPCAGWKKCSPRRRTPRLMAPCTDSKLGQGPRATSSPMNAQRLGWWRAGCSLGGPAWLYLRGFSHENRLLAAVGAFSGLYPRFCDVSRGR